MKSRFAIWMIELEFMQWSNKVTRYLVTTIKEGFQQGLIPPIVFNNDGFVTPV